MQYLYMESPLGPLRIIASYKGIVSVEFVEKVHVSSLHPNEILLEAKKQLEEYFNKKRRRFDLPLDPEGTEFQRKVWKLLGEVPYGRVVTYTDIALRYGDRNAVRAIGAANGRNRIGIIIPCHRVIASDGSLSGYAAGVWRKEWLLTHERAINPPGKQMSLF
ncbi:methylated-DNA--[protein]-cysteine S-methyltransferase [Limibacter armeniacum]|uniref:methylated-DNA--[protein]-cysteine S-methyltransferase n=1 Tax=Limibacter armeniacum TaxID=466084 RepID=UPI002FE6A8CD